MQKKECIGCLQCEEICRSFLFVLQIFHWITIHKIICKMRKFTVKINEKIYGYAF